VRLGVLLPHFGPQTDHERLFALGSRLEAQGFSSAWTRDHLGYSGGVAFEADSAFFVDPLITLASVAATSGLTIGTAALTPIRQPVLLAQMIGSLSYLARGRVILGVGLGKPRAAELIGHSADDRLALFDEMVDVLRAVAQGPASYEGTFTSFDDLVIDPAPPADLPLWYCGASQAAVRRAVERTDGWLPGRCPFPTFDRFHARLRELAAERSKTMSVGIVPLVSLDKDRETALSKINVAGLLQSFRDKPALRPDGPFESVDELRGAVLAGTVQDVLEDLKALEGRGVDEVVLDLRERMDAFDDALQCISEEILPAFSSTPPRASRT
jgi:alkanesulfonate monooxygenase SsuD/methylene tetrahydromethanopterin reductase-like flavin-dependent oxidoreductase (luciferase family)